MNEPMQVNIDELLALHAKATEAPWCCYESDVRAGDCADDQLHGEHIADCSPGTDGFTTQGVRNSYWLVAIHNAFPALAAEIARLREMERALRSVVSLEDEQERKAGMRKIIQEFPHAR